MASNVNLVDPLEININVTNDANGVPFVNGIPQYQDMYIFAELTAKSKARTVIVTTNDGNVSQGIVKTGFEKPKKANLLGVNQITEDAEGNAVTNPNYLNFTTNYYDGSTGNYTQFESFGISNIKVVVNSSYVPQVNIQFVDIRGLSFFNQEKSPYRVLFDFPPPIFDLSFKGYYGKILSYQLHLVKYTSEFQSDTGNFVIDAQFVAVTFAPLSDILFRYIINAPLIPVQTADSTQVVSISPETNAKPVNTYDLILKLKNLYTSITDKVKTSSNSKNYDKTVRRINDIKNVTAILENYKTDPLLENLGPSYLIIKTSGTPAVNLIRNPAYSTLDEEITQLNILSDYDEKIKAFSDDSTQIDNIKDRLFLVIQAQYNLGNIQSDPDSPLYHPGFPFMTTDEAKISNTIDNLDSYRKKLIKAAIDVIGIPESELTTTIKKAEFDNNYDLTHNVRKDNTSTKYVGLDVTDYYIKLYYTNSDASDEKRRLADELTTKINNMVMEKLGMMPTIYNIFEIICNDVDKFFKLLHDVSKEAESVHHANPTNEKIILGGNYKDYPGKIYAFPLIVNKRVVCGGDKEERIAPIDLSKRTLTPFPEILFVNDFINTFFTQKNLEYASNMRGNQDAEGNNEWLPISPFDSMLVSDDMKSPYINVDMALNLSEDYRLSQVLKIVLDRFYILSQYTVPDNFYKITNGKKADVDNEYIKLYATSEAANLAATAINSVYYGNLKEFAKKYKDNVKGFFDYISSDTALSEYYNFTETSKPFIQITDSSLVENSDAYTDKENPEYTGVFLSDAVLTEQHIEANSKNPIEIFKSSVQKTGFLKLFKKQEKEVYYDFCKENVLYIRDKKLKKDGTEKTNQNLDDGDGNVIITRFLCTVEAGFFPVTYASIQKNRKDADYQNLINSGNTVFGSSVASARQNLSSFANITNVWATQLSTNYTVSGKTQYFDDLIYDGIISHQSRLSALFLLANFGNTLGPFNTSPFNLNKLIFTTPATIQVPRYLSFYIGALISAYEDNWYQDIIDYFTVGDGKNFYDRSMYIFADYSDFNKYISEIDKKQFLDAFNNDFYVDGTINGEYLPLLLKVQQLYAAVKGGTEHIKQTAYEKLLDPKNSDGYYVKILQPLIKRTNMIVFSQNTFKMSKTYNPGYKSLATLNANADNKADNYNYFSIFLTSLYNNIEDKNVEARKKKEEDDKKKGDDDIITQTYYSFKNINDKWLSSPIKESINGYPFNESGGHLIDLFVFVDRAMNPIGDTVLNAEILVQLFDDPNVTVFSALSQLLSLNGFEFFPLQNFMVDKGSWEDSFKIDTSGDINKRAAFVCMYIGGTSSYPTGIGNGFQNDGIIDLKNTEATDFSTGNCSPNQDLDKQLEKNEKTFPYRQVRAFKVKFGQQNQSMFRDIKIDSKEYPETNESIQILSRLAGDNKEHAIPKGQNLFNLYENRSYKATVIGLGNAMIQPTQYFQLENVPLFNGAYIILTVEHNITANKMETSFSGTKIMKYPVPRVTSPLAFMSFEGGESYETNNMSPGQLVQGASPIDSKTAIRYNSMYSFNIQ
jgi:hypothetical protein